MFKNIEHNLNSIPSLKAATNYTTCSLNEAVKIRATAESLAITKPQTMPDFFRECCQKFKNLPALAYETICAKQENGHTNNLIEEHSQQTPSSVWTTVTYAEYEQHVEQAALLLLHLGVQSRSSVSILAINCPEWFYLQLGALRIGAVVAGIYTSNSVEAVHYVLETSEATVCLVDDAHQMLKVRACKSRLNQLRAIIQLNGPFDDFVGNEEGYYRWSDLFGMKFSLTLREELLLRERDVAANECALLIYTSGTVGMPKGVMVSHDGVLFCCRAITKALPDIEQGQGSTVTYLPLNHIAAQLVDIFVSMESGALVYFADRNALKGTLGKTYAKAQPTMLFGVPRIFEKIQENLIKVDTKSSEFTKFIMNTARDVVQKYHMDKMEGKPTSTFKYWLASKVVYKIKLALGLQRCKALFIGGAPVSEELKKFLLSLDLPLVDVYGMSEASGGIVYNFNRPNLKTVGKPIEGMEIKINNADQTDEGEILVRGRANFMGYLKDPQKTEETITFDGWIRTGDSGYLDEEGNLYINGRLKELIITSGGENIPPLHIEALIKKELPCISNAVVIGDHKKYLTVLLTLKTDIDPNTGYPLDTLRPDTIEWLESLDLSYTLLSEVLHTKLPKNLIGFDPTSVEVKTDDKVLQALGAGIKRANQQAISNAQIVQYFSVLPHDFSIPTNELGPTLKIRRNIVHQKYAKIIDKMYKKHG